MRMAERRFDLYPESRPYPDPASAADSTPNLKPNLSLALSREDSEELLVEEFGYMVGRGTLFITFCWGSGLIWCILLSPVPMDTFKRDMQWTTLPWGHTGGNAKAGKKKGKAMDRILAMETEDTSSE